MIAKQAATLDEVSGGRFVLGIGTGDAVSRAEHEVYGLPYLDERIRRDHLVETIRAVRTLWRGQPWLGGGHVPRIAGPLLPGPRTAGGPPIWVGGTSEGAVRVAAGEADGWNGWGLATPRFAERARLLASSSGDRVVEPTWGGVVVVGRDGTDAERVVADRRERGLDQTWAGSADAATIWLAGLRDAGATWAILLAVGGADRVELIADRVLPGFGPA
jgi:alkanesulfonate monooxygenase SsuD/methylene tetrahydromethanopterin reductase-like flavin-dependent oxidoreductase (luciferase family)